MLIVSLILSGVLLVAVNVTAFRSRSVLRSLWWCGLGVFGLAFCVIAVLPTFLLHAALTLVAGLVCAWVAPRPRVFLATTIVAFLIAYGVTGVPKWLEHDKLKRETASISVEDRLAYEDRPLELPDSPSVGADVHLISMPRNQPGILDKDGGRDWQSNFRERALQQLHEGQVSAFVNSPGFGVGRSFRPTNRDIELPDESPVPIDESGSIPQESAASMLVGGHAALDPTSPDLDSLHRASVLDFAFPQGFGYVKDRSRVYGFRPHRISKTPTEGLAPGSWRFRKLELVSLLKHSKPAVYVSANLPRMSDLHNAPTRPLDAFESAALPRLAKDDLVVHSTDDRLRVLGSIRAAEACLACHAKKQGDLLGAFSYHLDKPGR